MNAAKTTERLKQVVLIPSYNTGPRLLQTVQAALGYWEDVWVVVDGSDDGSEIPVVELAETNKNLTVIIKSENGGKGSAVLYALEQLIETGYTHILTMDADGQHPAADIPDFMQVSATNPNALIMGKPIFGPDVPPARLQGRKLTIFWTDIETLHCGLGDTLFGMRVYPAKPLLKVFQSTSFARGYDFDPEVAVRLCWQGVMPVQRPTPVRYFKPEEGGVSHFNYLRDNIKLTLLHFRLIPEFLLFKIGSFRMHLKGRNGQ